MSVFPWLSANVPCRIVLFSWRFIKIHLHLAVWLMKLLGFHRQGSDKGEIADQVQMLTTYDYVVAPCPLKNAVYSILHKFFLSNVKLHTCIGMAVWLCTVSWLLVWFPVRAGFPTAGLLSWSETFLLGVNITFSSTCFCDILLSNFFAVFSFGISARAVVVHI